MSAVKSFGLATKLATVSRAEISACGGLGRRLLGGLVFDQVSLKEDGTPERFLAAMHTIIRVTRAGCAATIGLALAAFVVFVAFAFEVFLWVHERRKVKLPAVLVRPQVTA